MIKSRNKFRLLPLYIICLILLLVVRHFLHMYISDIHLFVQYTSPMEKSLADLTQLMGTSTHQPSNKGTLFHAFVIGGMFSIGIAYLFIYIASRRRVSALYFALAGIMLGLRLSFTKETLFMRVFYDFSPEAMIYGDLLTGMIALLFFLMFYSIEFIHPRYNKYMKVFASIMILYIVILLIFPLQILIHTFFVYQILSLVIMFYIVLFTIITTIKYKTISYLNLIGFSILFLLSWNDIFQYSEEISTNEFIMFGVFAYFICLAIYLAINLSQSYARVDQLTVELKGLNKSLEEKVERRTEQLVAANAALKKAEEARGRLLTNVSHELNTPLSFIQGYVKGMLDEIIPKNDTTYLRAIYDDTKMMSYMIRDLQELSIIEMGHLSFKLTERNIGLFMEQLFLENKTVFKEKEIEFTFHENSVDHIDTELVYIDPVRIKQVVNNLIVNAKKFTPKGGEIKLCIHLTEKDHRQVAVISVSDTGEGIREGDLPYIFEMLYKVDSEQNHLQKGSGLGLAIAKEIVEFHQGEIGVESVYGKGSTFYFTLPLISRREHVEGESVNR